MTDNVAPDPQRNYDDVLAEYLEAESPEDWLVWEVCNYLFEDVPHEELDDRIERFDAVMEAERNSLLEEIPSRDDVVLYTVAVDHGDEEEYVSFRGCPSAALLLEACVGMAEPGEGIEVVMVFGDGTQARQTLAWPFPMEVAVAVTSPMPSDTDEALERLDGGDAPSSTDTELFTFPEHRVGRGLISAEPLAIWQDPVAQQALAIGALAGVLAGVLTGLAVASRWIRNVTR